MDEKPAAPERGSLAWLGAALGMPLLGYLLNRDSAEVRAILDGELELGGEQLQVIEALSTRREAMPQEIDEMGISEALRHWLLQLGDGQSNAMLLHKLTSDAVEPAPASADEVEATFVALAREVYPAFLMPMEVLTAPGMPVPTAFLEEINEQISTLIAALPAADVFIHAVRADTVLGGLFRGTHPVMGVYAAVYLNTGHGGPVFLARLPTLTLRAAWREIQDSNPTEERFVAEGLRQLAIVRRVLGGRTAQIKARFAFTGVLLPAAGRIDLGNNGVVRPATDADRRYAPGMLQQQLGGTPDAQGVVPYISYAGDVIRLFTIQGVVGA
ncbi:hypothetical protein ACFPJ1_37065 [Kribbella qitaiheensis]|uniref:hypothetical protein n=1 Tax=Kribbella qitaiheensis TaxID=1544730 RepID=UPI00361E11AD